MPPAQIPQVLVRWLSPLPATGLRDRDEAAAAADSRAGKRSPKPSAGWVANAMPTQATWPALRSDEGITVKATTEVRLRVMDGEPIVEPIIGHGPFVINNREEIQRAFGDYQLGRAGELAERS